MTLDRRRFFQGILTVFAGGAACSGALPRKESEKGPQSGDWLVHADGVMAGEPVEAASVLGSERSFLVFPQDPESGLVRNARRQNLAVLCSALPDAAAREDVSIVAYSAICTHQECIVSRVYKPRAVLICGCHYSKFDISNGARVISGPAPRPLASLPVENADGLVRVVDGFQGPVTTTTA